jgi:hypothetical protein
MAETVLIAIKMCELRTPVMGSGSNVPYGIDDRLRCRRAIACTAGAIGEDYDESVVPLEDARPILSVSARGGNLDSVCEPDHLHSDLLCTGGAGRTCFDSVEQTGARI